MRRLIPMFLLLALPAFAQDPAAQAMQQQQQQQINSQMQATAASATEYNGPTFASKPKFEPQPGPTPGTMVVRLKDRTRGAVMYYTTDGWTPTLHSPRYTGPITVSSDTNLQAVAYAPGFLRSHVASASLAPAPAATSIPAGAAVPSIQPPSARLVFTATVHAKGLQIGDPLPVALAEDLSLDGQVVATRGTPVLTTVTQADGPGRGGSAGSVSFAVHSVTGTGRTIQLSADYTKEGLPVPDKKKFLIWIPVVGGAELLERGGDAVILQGTTLAAKVQTSASSASTR